MATITQKENETRKQTTPTNAPAHLQDDLVIDTSRMSKGKREALELAEDSRDNFATRSSFCGSMFVGRFDWKRMHPYPVQPADDKAAGDAFLAELNDYLRENTDPDQIDLDGEIPQPVVDDLAKMGAFGIKVDKEYQGLGLSQTNYSRAAVKLGSWCGNLTALVSAHQSIGVSQPLLVFGTEAQKKKYLPRVAQGEISAFALTETGVGSDPAKMATTAEPTDDGHWIINGEKLWCTNGTRAGVIVVMARTPSKVIKGRERNMITAFIVDMDTPGVTVKMRCRFVGLRALYNGVIHFEHVKVPAENIIAGEGKGLKVALTTLNTGRLTLPAACAGLSKRCLAINREWAGRRVQWGSPVGHHAAIAEKISRMAANLFATEAMTFYAASLVDRQVGDIRLEAAISKMWGTERGWEDVDETMQIRGGRGYETVQSQTARGEKNPQPVERLLRDARINTIFEGSSEIMRLFIAREALDPHLKLGGAAMNSQLPMGTRLKTGLKAAGFYAFWYPKQWLPAWFTPTGGVDARLRKHIRYAAGGSRKLARTLFHNMIKFGPRLEREQVVLRHLVDIGAELFAIAAACSYADHKRRTGEDGDNAVPLADYFAREARLRIAEHHRAIRKNNNARGYNVARAVLNDEYTWLESGRVE